MIGIQANISLLFNYLLEFIMQATFSPNSPTPIGNQIKLNETKIQTSSLSKIIKSCRSFTCLGAFLGGTAGFIGGAITAAHYLGNRDSNINQSNEGIALGVITVGVTLIGAGLGKICDMRNQPENSRSNNSPSSSQC